MLYEVKYGISLQMTKVVVDPLAAPAAGFSYILGGVWIDYSPTAFHAELTLAHTGARAFRVTKVQPGSWTVSPTGVTPFKVAVGADGVLSFSAAVGKGLAVDAVKGA